ncbi:MAG TPA: hypothetical protein VFC78_11910 [Tepidisphaeraceae bacterium]|nr:hypothetical protein [Tepidisphaeraceae bacterium]
MEVCDPIRLSPIQRSQLAALGQPQRMSDRLLALLDRHRKAFFAGVFLIYLLGFNAQWRVERDSALYLSIGRNLAHGLGYTYRGQPHNLLYSGFPTLIAGTFRVFHTQSIVPALVLMLLMGLATLGLTYRLFLLHSGRPTAVLVTVGLGVTRLFYRYSFELLSDMPFLLGVMAFLVGYEALSRSREDAGDGRPRESLSRTQWLDWALLFVGLGVAVTMRPTMWVLVAAIVLALVWRAFQGTVNWVLLGVAVAAVAAAVAFRRAASGTDEYERNIFGQFKHLGPLLQHILHHNLHDLFEATLIKSLFGCAMLRAFNSVIGLLIIGLGVAMLRYRLLWGLLVLLTIGVLLVTKPLDRYLLPVIPLLVYGWWRFLVWLNHRLPVKWADLAFLALLIGGLSTNMARVGEMVVEQRRAPFLAHFHNGRYESAPRVARLIARNTPQFPDGGNVWILTEPNVARIMTFLSDRNTFDATEPVPFDPAGMTLYALVGPSWEDSKPKAPVQATPMEVWLTIHALQLDAPVGRPVKGKYDSKAWILYTVRMRS